MATQGNSRSDALIADEQGIYQRLAADHRTIEALFEELASAGDDMSHLRELHAQLKREIILHTNVEDRVVYMPIEGYEGFAATIEHARDEHQDANALLLELDDMELGSQAFMDKAEELRQTLAQHISEEENEVLPAALGVMDRQASRQMAQQFETEKVTELETIMETEPGTSALDEMDLEAMSREELAELARQSDIAGRSHMSREELAQALRERR
jgi:DNA-binding phage protein